MQLAVTTQEVLHHLNTLTWACLVYADGAACDEELQLNLEQLDAWLKNDPRAVEILKQHGMEMMAHDLLIWGGLHAPLVLKERYRLGVVARLATEKIYGDVLERLLAAGIKVVVQKGFWLASNVYPVPNWRQYADLDLLIPSGAMFKMDALMRELEFRPLYSALPERASLPKWVDADVIDCLEFKRDVYHVDVHFTLVPHVLPNRCRLSDVWQETLPETVMAGGRPLNVEILNPYTALMHLAMHANCHCMGNGFRALLDMVLMQRYFMEGTETEKINWGGKWDWREFVERCRRWDMGYLVAGPLLLAQTLMLPEERLIADEIPKQLDKRGKVRLRFQRLAFLETFVETPAQLAVTSRDFFAPLLGAGWWRHCRALLHYLFPRLRRLAARYNYEPSDVRLLVFYLLRPIQLLWKFFPTVVRRWLAG